jgi:hypothetical protein
METTERRYVRWGLATLTVFLLMFGPLEARAELPDICISSPVGRPYYTFGDSITIRWETRNYNPETDPDQADITSLSIWYRWDGDTTLNYITSRGRGDAGMGTHVWGAPPVAIPLVRSLRLVFRFEPSDMGAPPIVVQESDLVWIACPTKPRVWLSSPLPMASPTQTLPPTCFDHLQLEGGTTQWIDWEIVNCDDLDLATAQVVVKFAEDGIHFTTNVHTNYSPCTVPGILWTLPEVNTTNAKFQVTLSDAGGTKNTYTSAYPFEITSEPVNQPPVANAGEDQTVTGRDRVTLRAGESYDPDGDPLTYYWSLLEGPGMYTGTIDIDNSDSSLPNRFVNVPSVTYECSFTFQISVRDPYHVPDVDQVVITVQPNPDDPDGDWTVTDDDNCPEVANPGQEDVDHDGVGDACDNCRTVSNSNQNNLDLDWLGNVCDPCPYDAANDADDDGYCADVDNCPDHANTTQTDWDGDGEGDACDCNDGFPGPNEAGMDCGTFLCGTPCPDSVCQPLIRHGSSSDKIDVVLIPGDDYWNPLSDPYHWMNPLYFASQDALDDLLNSYFADPIVGSPENRTKFNIWYTTATRGEVDVDDDGNCDWDDGDWRDDCPEGDIAFIAHPNPCRDYSSGDVFSTEPDSPGVLLHETGHILFDLGDEYDDMDTDCTTYYGTAEYWSKSNIWRTEGYCEDYTSLDPSDCYKFTDCQSKWYKAQRGPTIMECSCAGYPDNICDWGPDARRMVDHVMAGYESAFASSDFSGAADDPDDPSGEAKVLVGYFHYGPGGITLAKMNVLYGTPPEHWLEKKGVRTVIKDAGGSVLAEFAIRDPRYQDFPEIPPGGGWLKEVDFSTALPFFENAKTLAFFDGASGTPLGLFDVSPYAHTFCAEFPGDVACRCEGDLDGDRVVDGQDLSLFSDAYKGQLAAADLNGDQSVDMKDVGVFARDFGREDCPDLKPPDCDDHDLCTSDFYDPITKQCVHREKTCFDGSPCTLDFCNPQTGECVYKTKTCSDGDPCTTDRCDHITGECINEPVVCDDGDACTTDMCEPKTGQCMSTSVNCNDGDPCTWDLCDPVSGCFHVDKVCDDQDPCTIDSCGPKGECIHTPDATCGACCINQQLIPCREIPAAECKRLGGTFKGVGTVCKLGTCP